MDVLLDDLRDVLARGKAVVIVGAGVASGATNNNPLAGWQGLLDHGVDRCVGVVASLPPGWADRIHAQIASGDVQELLSAAENIASRLGAPEGGEYGRWLRETVGGLRAEHREVLEALRDLGAPLATTNYDGLLEEVTGWDPVTWRDGARVERVLRGDEQGVLHLHGFWREPESVVLGIRSYGDVLGSAHAQTVQQGLRLMNSLVFVGCGSGLADPNFGAFLRWTRGVFAGSEYRQFLLARASQVFELQEEHPPDERLFVVSYGPDHADLAPFLRGLQPTGPLPAPASSIAPAPLPGRPRCLGRDAVVTTLVTALLQPAPAPIPILGPPGIGKSTVALTALHAPAVAEHFGERRYVVRCDGALTAGAVLAEVARTVGLRLDGDVATGLAERIYGFLRTQPSALVLDNAETPWEADPVPTEELLRALAGIPQLGLVVALRGAQRPFGVPWQEAIQLTPLQRTDARELFLAVAGARFGIDPHLDELLQALGDVPLAVELMGYVAEGEPDLGTTWDRWQAERVKLLQRQGVHGRHENFEVSLELSIGGPRMNPAARRLLALIAQLPDGISHGDLPDILPGVAAEAAGTLRKVGLAFDERDRLLMLAPIGEHVRAMHPPTESDSAHAMGFYRGLADTLGPRVGYEGGADAIRRLAAEWANIEMAIGVGLEASDPMQAVKSALATRDFVRFSGLGDAHVLASAARAAAAAGDILGEANCIEGCGEIALVRSEHDQASDRFEEALPLYRRADNVLGEANCIFSLGDIALRRTEYDLARDRFEEALPLCRRAGGVIGEANCIRSLGDVALARSEYERARDRFEEALPIYRRGGNVLGEANCIRNLGSLALRRSEYDQARHRFEEALPLYRRARGGIGEANCIWDLGNVALARLEHDQARVRFEEALTLYRRKGSVLGQANCISYLGDLDLGLANYVAARARFEQAIPLYRQVGQATGAEHYARKLQELEGLSEVPPTG